MHEAERQQRHTDMERLCWRSLCCSSPGVPYGHQGDITIWAELQDAVLWLYPDSKQLDVLRRVGAHTRVLLQAGGRQIKETTKTDLKIITLNILFQNFRS